MRQREETVKRIAYKREERKKTEEKREKRQEKRSSGKVGTIR